MKEYSSGTAQLINMGSYIDWYRNLSEEDCENVRALLLKHMAGEIYRRTPETAALEDMFPHSRALIELSRSRALSKIQESLSYAESADMPFRVKRWVTNIYSFLYLGNPNTGFIVVEPEKYLKYIPEKDFTGMTPAQILAESQVEKDDMGMSIVPGNCDGLTVKGIQSVLSEKKSAVDQLKKQMQDVKDAKEKGLAALQAEIEAKQAELKKKQESMIQDLNKKQAEMESAIEQMETQLFLLESQIYAIRCYSGETTTLTQIRAGKKAPDNEPIVIHQKLRFLDEDLGRLASLYEITWDNLKLFEDFLRYSPVALDTFAPNERCVMLVRLSRNGRTFHESGQFPYSNILESYNYFHGKTVGIIIRNGENLYLGWTDNEKVHINDDFIVTQIFTETVPVQPDDLDKPLSFWEEQERKEQIKQERKERRELMDGIVSRVFIYNILQGIVDTTDLMPLPEGVKVNSPSQYVVFSVADRWLSDTRFESFTKIVEQCNARVSRGDMLLTVQRLVPERCCSAYYSHAWQNVRGRGDANRTHDCIVNDCTLYPVNLVETEEGGDSHIYISVEKQDSGWLTDKKARANFEIYAGEFINLTYMNSVWLEWVINNKTLGDWRVGGERVDYAFAIRYLKTAMNHVRKRELHEKECLDAIDPHICEDPDWPLRLSQWKLNTNVRAINPYQASRFAKSLR